MTMWEDADPETSEEQATPGLSRLVRDERGAAYTEAVIMLPVFFVIFALFYQVYRTRTAKFETMQSVRTAAWMKSNAGCEDDEGTTCPSGTEGCTVEDGDAEGGIDGVLSDLRSDSDPLLAPFTSLLGGLLENVFGTAVTKSASLSVTDPKYIGGTEWTMSTKYTLMCNPLPTTLWELLEKLFKDLISSIFPF